MFYYQIYIFPWKPPLIFPACSQTLTFVREIYHLLFSNSFLLVSMGRVSSSVSLEDIMTAFRTTMKRSRRKENDIARILFSCEFFFLPSNQKVIIDSRYLILVLIFIFYTLDKATALPELTNRIRIQRVN